ncbi:YraN family protein [Fluviispira multicolorata]|uniref:Endonuclease n=1 Tax=Fluviispira multicolorata TaxID=2654512 RepID=A0A833N0D9_9BACT|nr:YraN family protein [Fluviispira multicolorata]KAB8028487.1 hypothetical protein GCL57_12240 [Fluviispira multicolorata]
MDTKYRKKLGEWGEYQVDKWMEKHRWFPIKKNVKIKRGEIDRIYSPLKSLNKKQLCLVEIKTRIISSQKEINEIFSESGVKKYFKTQQIKNLHIYGEQFRIKYQAKIYIRIFIILKIKHNFNKKYLLNFHTSIKICHVCHEYLILSIEPEFTNIQLKKSTLEILI